MIAEYEIRLAAPGDAREISELSRDTIEHGLPWRWTAQRIAHCITDDATNVAVARQAGALLGFASMKYEEEQAHMLLFAVHPARRRKGVGAALLSWLEETVRVAGIDLIWLEARASNAAAIAFYRRHGFEELGVRRGYYQGVEDAVRMAKDLWRHF